MSRRQCLTDRCVELCLPGRSRCPQHGSSWDRKPPARDAAAYGYGHQLNRVRLLREAGCIGKTGLGGRCALCGGPGTPEDPLVADHIRPVSQGGGSEYENLRAIHNSENHRRGVQLGNQTRRRKP